MNELRSTVLCSVSRSTPASVARFVPRVACLLALSSILTGCTPEQDEPVLPYTHNAGNATVQLFSATPADIRHHQRLAHVSRATRRHPTTSTMPEAPAPIN